MFERVRFVVPLRGWVELKLSDSNSVRRSSERDGEDEAKTAAMSERRELATHNGVCMLQFANF